MLIELLESLGVLLLVMLLIYGRFVPSILKISKTGNGVELFALSKKMVFGNFLFDKFLGVYSPYSGSISPHVIELSYERAILTLKERRALTNPFNSIHACALTNLGELVTKKKY